MAKDNINDILKTLETAYLEGQYQAGIDILLDNKESFGPGVFHYNLGTLHVKKQDYPVGLFHFEKSLLSGFVNPKLLKNMNSTKEILSQTTYKVENSLKDLWYFKVAQLPFEVASTLSLGFLLVFALFFKNLKKLQAKHWATLFIAAALPMLFFFGYSKSFSTALALKEAAVQEGPSAVYEQSTTLPPGTKVILGKKSGAYLFIKAPIDYAGWISRQDLGILR